MGVIKAKREQASEVPEGITCPKYERGEGKRCRHYVDGGACKLTDEFMCVEWLKVNEPTAYERARRDLHLLGPTVPESAAEPTRAPPTVPERVGPHSGAQRYDGPTCAEVINGKKCGEPVRWSPGGEVCSAGHGGCVYDGEMPPRPTHLGTNKSRTPEELMATPRAFDPALITDASLAELEASGVECLISTTDLCDVWLVPAFTKEDRSELTYRMARTLLVTMSVFPGAILKAMRRPNPRITDA